MSSDPYETRLERVADVMQRVIADAVLRNELIARRLGMGVVDLQTLGILMRGEAESPGALAERTGLPTSTVTRILDRLEERGLVRREPDAADRRRVHVALVGDPFAGLDGDPYAGIIEGLRAVNRGFTLDELDIAIRYLEALTPRPDADASAPSGPASPATAARP